MRGFSDWTRAMKLLGEYAGSDVSIAVDSAGRLYCVLAGGVITNIEGPIDVEQVNAERAIQGTDGETLHVVAVDNYGQIIMVPRGVSGTYMDVDENGFLTTVIKGDYLGEPKTLGVDTDGRIKAFVYDTIDAWGQIASVGFAELAARLGSPVCYERSGQIAFVEDFANGLNRWDLVANGTGASIKLSVAGYVTGGYSCAITGGSAGDLYSYIGLFHGTLPVGKFGLSYMLAIAGAYDRHRFSLSYRTGTQWLLSEVQLVDTGKLVQVNAQGLGWTTVGTFNIAYRTRPDFYGIKMVVDLVTGKYDKVRLGHVAYDVSAYDLFSTASTEGASVNPYITHYSRSGNNDKCWIDSVVLTFAEP